MYYKVINASSPTELVNKVNEVLQEGYEIVGSHQAVIRKALNRFRGSQHTDTLNEIEYTQTVVNKTDIVKSLKEKLDLAIETLKTVYKDAEMAIDGEWDKSDEGFADQMIIIDNALSKIKHK